MSDFLCGHDSIGIGFPQFLHDFGHKTELDVT